MGKMQRRKGASFERRVVNIMRRAGFDAAKRGIGQTRAASEVPDVDLPGWWPECKHHILTNPRGAFKQAQRDSSKSGRTPFAVCQDNGGKPFVHIDLLDFLELLYAAKHYAHGVDDGAGPARRPRSEWLNPAKETAEGEADPST